jgi:putative oxidoreductase
MRTFFSSFNDFFSQKQDFALLCFRVVVGAMFMWHGFPKITGGPDVWIHLGSTMKVFGITAMPVLWGFMPAIIEFFGGLFLLLGLGYRFAALFLFCNMMMAFSTQLLSGTGLSKASQSLEDGFSFIAALGVGPGKYSLDHFLLQKKTN